MPVSRLIRLCSRIVKPDGELHKGWKFDKGKRPPTLSDFKLSGENWKACSKTVNVSGDACKVCVGAIEIALKMTDRLSPEICPYFEATLERHRYIRERANAHAVGKRKRLAERMKSSPDTTDHLYVMHNSSRVSCIFSVLLCVWCIVAK